MRNLMIIASFLLGFLTVKSFEANVTYDHRALVIDGKRRVLISGAIHYPRSTPEMWPDLIKKSRDGGLDVIETYVFWDLHEPVQYQYDFKGRKDLVKFVKLVAEAGLYLHLRIGPYVCAEWNYGGFPLWLHFIPGIKFRTDNEPFKAEMQRFTAKIVDMMKQEKLFASQGGPIIMSQIENEYGNLESEYGPAGKSYINWAAKMATSLDTGVPWNMCQQPDAPDPVINTCNGFYCDQFNPNSYNKPKMWTENWSGWFLSFGGPVPYRPVEDLAFAVARFFQRGGTFQNYYMYHGGTNFDRTSGGPFIATTYDYDAPIDEFGLLRQPKWGHLKDLHMAIKHCEQALVATDSTHSSPGSNLEVSVYRAESGLCVAFLANTGTSDSVVNFNGNSYSVPAWSVSILPDCKKVVFNTAKVNSVSVIPKFEYRPLKENANPSGTPESDWSWVNEPVGISRNDAFTRDGLTEQINTTADRSDYLWYSISIDIKGNEPYLQNGLPTILRVQSLGHALHAFINGKLSGSAAGNISSTKLHVDFPVILIPGNNKIDLLSLTVGLQNYGPFFDIMGAGITGPVSLRGLKNGTEVDLSSQQWTYQVGLKGDELGVANGAYSQWVSGGSLPKKQPLTWYKTNFDAPAGNDPIALVFNGMGKGEAWVNGQSIGRYWPSYFSSNASCSESCSYIGSYDANKCIGNCGRPSQERYHAPRSWLQPTDNTLIVFEETGGDPTQISFAAKQAGSICSQVSESHPSPISMWTSDADAAKNSGPTLSLECAYPSQTITGIKFASFGTPEGNCGHFGHGSCSSTGVVPIVEKACIGSNSCSIGISTNTFGDPCMGVTKSLAVEASCS